MPYWEVGVHSIIRRNCVIPAQVGIQQKNTPRSGKTLMVVPLRGGLFNHLDSRLRWNDGAWGHPDLKPRRFLAAGNFVADNFLQTGEVAYHDMFVFYIDVVVRL